MALSAADQIHELSYYTLSHADPSFIHQHVVDAHAAQMADKNTKPIAFVFALAGLYLYIEKGYTGKQVQQMHMQMAKNKAVWPSIVLPAERGSITVAEVLKAPAGEDRDGMIHNWCKAVWAAYASEHTLIRNLMQQYL